MNEENDKQQQNDRTELEPDFAVKKNKLKKKVKVKTKKKPKKNSIHIGIGSIILIIFCIFLLVTATFLQLNITHIVIPSKLFQGLPCNVEDYLYTMKYIPQIPVVLFVASLLGRKFGLISIIIYILMGLFMLPVFALGGGWRYIFEYGFGYILAYIPAAYAVTTVLKKGYTFKNILKSVCLGVLIIHFIGIIYMMCLAMLKHSGWSFVGSWIAAQSSLKIIYDIIFSFFAVFVTKYLRVILWFYL